MMMLWNNFKTTVLMAGLMGLCLAIGCAIGGRQALTAELDGAEDPLLIDKTNGGEHA